MVRTRGRDDSIVRRGQPRRGASTSCHGQLAINHGCIPYSRLSTWSNGGNPHVHHIRRPRLHLSHLCPLTHLLHPCPPTHLLHPQ